MDISFGFIIVFILILFPGLIIRKLFYYGEFSKQFSAGFSLIKLIAVSSIPGLVNLMIIFFLYDSLFSHINLEEIINTVKDLNDPEYHLDTNSSKSIKENITASVFPFLGFLYTSSLIIGSVSGRLIRITGIDTKFKLLRFKNYWFYAFSSEMTKFKKMKHLNEVNKKHLFTVADILVDSDGKSKLYSGVVIDYELSENNCQALDKIILQQAERYKLIDNKMERFRIPGNLFVVDCSKMKNINLTYIFEERTSFLKSKTPAIVDNLFSLVTILMIPITIFKMEFITWNWYINYFNLKWFEKLICYFLVIQVLALFNVFTKNKETGEYEYVGWWLTFYKIIFALVLLLLLWVL